MPLFERNVKAYMKSGYPHVAGGNGVAGGEIMAKWQQWRRQWHHLIWRKLASAGAGGIAGGSAWRRQSAINQFQSA